MSASSSTAPKKTTLPYGLWRSPMAVEELLSQPSAPMYPFSHHKRLHWLQALAAEGGRIALMERQPSGAVRCLTPAPFNIRTNAHEYGGRCFCLLGDRFIFNNHSDGRMYAQVLSAANAVTPPLAVTPVLPGQQVCFADLLPLANFDLVIAVMESSAKGRESTDQLVAVDLSAAAVDAQTPPRVLAEGSDFYACPVVSPNQTQLAWMEWDHPFMPWDQSRLLRARLSIADGVVELRKRQVVVERAAQAVCQLGFVDDHSLLFVSDSNENDYWNFYCHKNNQTQQITDDNYEYGEAHWQFGQHRWQAMDAHKIIAVGSGHDGDVLLEIALASGQTRLRAEGFAVCAHLCANASADELLFIARYADREAEIRCLPFVADSCATQQAVYGVAGSVAEHGCSQPQAITYPTRDGRQAYGYFYAPFNRRYRAPPNTKPPLLVVVHGGPTGRTTPELHALKQFFTSLGYAVLDINHRGSTGYGRAYRQSLLGQWGEIDATDIADGVDYVLKKNLADPQQVFIRGGSAGGYAVLRALTRFPQMFCGGACYYGIGNLITLAQITHKFEGYYTDRLIGEQFNRDAVYDPISTPTSRFIERSPIFQLARLRSPLILFQGAADKVVPPALSREVAALLKQKGIQYEYIEYADEGHGFRCLPNRIDSLQKETAFFASIIQARCRQSGDNS